MAKHKERSETTQCSLTPVAFGDERRATTTSNEKLKNATIKLFVERFRRMRKGRCGDVLS
jgi:hypothetical protein